MAIQHGIVEKMRSEFGKLFIGGISWDTDEDRLKEYFTSYGEVVETVIMRDRLTGRARGFGFVVFADPVVAERVVMEKHMIDGRAVEAKKAVPRDDRHGLNRNNGCIQGSPGPVGRTKKIFVGGLASTVTESEFKEYFDQFGSITDVVVMYDHNTHRPRGFGFITYNSEEAVDMVLLKTFHELNGKLVEVKPAVPKESSPGPSRSPSVGHSYGLGRPNMFLTDGYSQGYSMSSIGGYGVRMDSRFGPMGGGRSGFSPFSSAGYGMGMNLEPILSLGAFGGTSNSNRYTTPIGYKRGNERSQSMWTNGEGFGVFGNGGASWGSSGVAAQGGVTSFGHNSGNIGGFWGGGGGGGVGRNNASASGNLFGGGLMYGDATWQSSSNEVDVDVSG